MAAGNTDDRLPASVRLKTLIDRYIAPPQPTFADVRSAAELVESADNGGWPLPLPRFGDVLGALCDRLGPDGMSRAAMNWLLARLPDRISVEDANRFDSDELTNKAWLELARRLPPEDRARRVDWGFLGEVERISLLALLGPGPPEVRRSLCASIARARNVTRDSPGNIVGVLIGMTLFLDWRLVRIAVYGPAGARREFSRYALEPADTVADCVVEIGEALDYELGEAPTRGRLSAREFVRRRKRAASANAACYVRWRSAAVAACAALGRRGDAALRLGGYVFYEYGFESD